MLVWIDLEMTGLNEATDHILEIAAVVTDDQLNVLDQGVDLVIHQPPEVLELMDEVVVKMHKKSGLTEAVKASKISLAQAQAQVMEYIKGHVPESFTASLCGNSIYVDRRFLRRWMPEIDQYMHYRMVDVTSVRLVAECWLPAVAKKRPKKRDTHRAMDDILESVAELRFFKEHLFFLKEPPDTAEDDTKDSVSGAAADATRPADGSV